MPKTISDEKMKRAIDVIENTIEPRIGKIVEELNEYFKKQNIRVGVELKWFFDDTSSDPASKPTRENRVS